MLAKAIKKLLHVAMETTIFIQKRALQLLAKWCCIEKYDHRNTEG
jgi:hypothetical protein